MKIQGIEGMSADTIRDEINRGGRLVIYTYCVSILVMTFKRPAGIRLVPAGHSAAAGSWPWVVASLLLGWWGIPWGPIYTIETIYRNLSGGIDVTDDFMRQFAAPPPLAPAATAASSLRSAQTPAPATALRTPPPPPQGFNYKVAGLIGGAICLMVLLGLSLFCWVRQQEMPVRLVSGLNQPSVVTVNGTKYPLPPHGVRELTLPEGDVTVEYAGETQHHTFTLPFFDHLTDERVAVLNPDRAAVLAQADVIYYRDGESHPEGEKSPFTLLINQPAYFVRKPNYLFAKPEERISMSSAREVRTRLEDLTTLHFATVLEKIVEKNGYEAARDHLAIRARHEDSEAFLDTALGTLKRADRPAFFQVRLAERPVVVEWHRAYQNSMEESAPEHDLVAEYRAYLQAEPKNGALMYLLARVTVEEDEADRLWQAAATATPACAHAYGAMAYDAMSDGRFADALEHFAAAEKAGLAGASRRQDRRQALWALARGDAVLAELAAARQAEPANLAIVSEEIRATLFFRHDAAAAEKLRADCVSACKAQGTSAQGLTQVDAYLQLALAYPQQAWDRYATASATLNSPYLKFAAACSRNDLPQARDAFKSFESPTSERHLLLYLLAQRNGDPGAEAHYQQALARMQTQDGKHRKIARLLAATTPDPRIICAVRLSLEEKRILLTALGVHDPVNRAVYFETARKLNVGTQFPYYQLQPILAEST